MFDGLDPSVQVLLLDTAQLGSWAPHVRPHLEKMAAGSGGRYLFVDILTAIAARNMQMWLTLRGPDLIAVLVTEIINYPRARALRMVGVVGSKPRLWGAALFTIEQIAKRDLGCTKMEAFHIPRFRALLPGYVTSHWFSEKVL